MFNQLFRAQMMLQSEGEEEDEGDELDSRAEWCNKDDLIRDHEIQLANMEQCFDLSEPSIVVMHSFSPTEAARPSTSILQFLQPILIRSLQVGCHHKGRVLYGKLCVKPFQMMAVHTLLEDEVGHAAKLSVYNALPHQHNARQMGALFHKGLKVAIKEPYFTISMDGSLVIIVDNPADFVHNPKVIEISGSRKTGASSSSSSSAAAASSSSSSSSPDQLRASLEAHAFRKRGNQAFAAQDWKQAIRCYTDAVKILLQCKDATLSTPSSSSSPETSKELMLVYSNRAEARLRLKHFEAAESDARKALQLQKNHVKSLSRRGRALHGLHQYKEAALCFKVALQIAGDENGMSIKELRSALEASEICERQARTGKYDLLKIWREVEKRREPLCGEYIGPVEIGPARDRSLGRGLLVTRDVEPGDLLIVSTAVAHAKLVDRSSSIGLSEQEIECGLNFGSMRTCHEDLTMQVVERSLTSKRFYEQVNALSSTSARGIENNIPAMDLFAPKPISTKLNDVFDLEDEAGPNPASNDVENIRQATKNNAFVIVKEWSATLWLLPSFINHSCLPNACWVKVGEDVLLVRAVRHLTKGQEVTISYICNAAVPLSNRARNLQHCRDFECRCERCSFERTMEPFIKRLTLINDSQPGDIEGAIEVVQSLDWAFQNIKAFEDEKKKQWLCTSFYRSCLYVLCQSLLKEESSVQQRLETMLKSVHETLGGLEDLLIVVRQIGNLAECSPYVRGIVASMYVCMYGKQAPATLGKLVALRQSVLEKEVLSQLVAWHRT